MVERLVVFDFDGTLFNTPLPEEGKMIWEKIKGVPYPHKGWWSKPESLDLSVFDIKPIKSVYNQYLKEKSKPNTYIIILTSRLEKLRPYVENILHKYNIEVDELIMKYDEKDKGERILVLLEKMKDVKEIDVYDDRIEEINVYINLRNKLSNNILLNIYHVNGNSLKLVEFVDYMYYSIINEQYKLFKNNII